MRVLLVRLLMVRVLLVRMCMVLMAILCPLLVNDTPNLAEYGMC